MMVGLEMFFLIDFVFGLLVFVLGDVVFICMFYKFEFFKFIFVFFIGVFLFIGLFIFVVNVVFGYLYFLDLYNYGVLFVLFFLLVFGSVVGGLFLLVDNFLGILKNFVRLNLVDIRWFVIVGGVL